MASKRTFLTPCSSWTCENPSQSYSDTVTAVLGKSKKKAKELKATEGHHKGDTVGAGGPYGAKTELPEIWMRSMEKIASMERIDKSS